MPSTRFPLALVALVVLAGCAGLSGAGGTSPTAEESTTTPGLAESQTTTVPTPEAIDYRSLPNGTRQPVRKAVEDGSVTTDRMELDGLEPGEPTRLRYEGTLYRLSWGHAGLRAEYTLHRVEPANASAVEPSDDVVAYENLSPAARRLFDDAMTGAPSEQYGPSGFPEELMRIDFVEYRGTHYRPLVVVADIPQVTIEAEPVDSGLGTTASAG